MRCVCCGREVKEHHNEVGLCKFCFDLYRDGRYKFCVKCKRLMPSSCIDRNGVCEECTSTIKSSCFRYAEPNFYTVANDKDKDKDKDKVFIGFELEAGGLEYEDDACDVGRGVLQRSDDFLFLKDDCSIPEYGFEVVSQPATIRFHRRFNYADILQYMANSGLRSHDIGSCGLHVHVSRNALSTTKWIFVDWFVNRHKDFWVAVARRESSYYAAYTDFDYELKECNNKLKDVCGKPTDKFVAVNFCHENTVEFRIFRGSLRYETFIGTLELVHGLVKWAEQVKIHDVLLNGALPLYIDFIKNNDYPEGIEYLKYRNLI